MTTVVVIDDHPVLRDGVRAALAGTGVEVVGEASTALEGLAVVTELRPDVVLMDLGLPDLSGIEATRRVLAISPQTSVLAFTMSEEVETVFAALRAGAMGYLVKGVTRDDLVVAIRAVAGGDALFLGPTVARRVLGHFDGAQAGPGIPAAASVPDDPDIARLTEREREVLDLMAAGWGNARIAASMHLSPKTIRNHVSNVIGKLHAADRGEAIVRARKAGLGALDE